MIFPSVIVAGGKPEVEFQALLNDNTNNPSSTAFSYTFSAVPLGAEHSRRFVIIHAGVRFSSTAGASSVTVNGVSATSVSPYFWLVLLPTGSSASVVVSTSNFLSQGASIAVWTVKRLRYTTATDSGSTLTSVSVDVEANGIVLGAAGSNVGTNFTWTGASEDAEIAAESPLRLSAAHQQQSASGSVTVTVTPNSSPGAATVWLVSLR